MKTKRKPEAERTINLIGVDAVLFERVRASLRRGPFLLVHSPEALPADRVDLYVAHASVAGELPRRGLPVIAWGPVGMLRGAFLAGCDDYLRDPWSPEELEMRALAVLARARRCHAFPWGELSFEGDALLTPGGRAALTHHETLILRALLRFRGSPVSREALSLLARGIAGPPTSRTIDVHVASVRRKVKAVVPGAGRFITCVRRQGYMIS